MRTIDPSRGQHILEVAARLFARRHYHEVRMEDIAQQAEVAKGTLYRYFQDKEDLYLALILTGSQRLFEEVQAAIAAVDDPEEQVLIYVERSIQFFQRFPYFLDLVQRLEVSTAPEKLASLQACRQRFFQLAASIIVKLNGTGRFQGHDPNLAALALTGMTRQILRFHPQPWPDHLAEIIVRQFLHGLHPGSAERSPVGNGRRPAARGSALASRAASARSGTAD
jgi:AcrR family transcriptional regulator